MSSHDINTLLGALELDYFEGENSITMVSIEHLAETAAMCLDNNHPRFGTIPDLSLYEITEAVAYDNQPGTYMNSDFSIVLETEIVATLTRDIVLFNRDPTGEGMLLVRSSSLQLEYVCGPESTMGRQYQENVANNDTHMPCGSLSAGSNSIVVTRNKGFVFATWTGSESCKANAVCFIRHTTICTA